MPCIGASRLSELSSYQIFDRNEFHYRATKKTKETD
jgi:hypothetical protein